MDWTAHSWRADLMRTVPCGPQQTIGRRGGVLRRRHCGRQLGVRPRSDRNLDAAGAVRRRRREPDSHGRATVQGVRAPDRGRGDSGCKSHVAHRPTGSGGRRARCLLRTSLGAVLTGGRHDEDRTAQRNDLVLRGDGTRRAAGTRPRRLGRSDDVGRGRARARRDVPSS